jgi:hypothetical protein
MDKIIKDIIHRNVTSEQKLKALQSLEDDISMAKRIISKEFSYCDECDDYYLTESFLSKKEVKAEKICTYVDPNQSSGNEYKDGNVEYHYSVCPKGHKHIVFKREV